MLPLREGPAFAPVPPGRRVQPAWRSMYGISLCRDILYSHQVLPPDWGWAVIAHELRAVVMTRHGRAPITY